MKRQSIRLQQVAPGKFAFFLANSDGSEKLVSEILPVGHPEVLLSLSGGKIPCLKAA